MTLERQSSPNDISPEQDREAFIQEAVVYAQKTYALEKELASLQFGHASEKQKYVNSNTSRAAPRRTITGQPAVSHRSQPSVPSGVLLPLGQHAIRQMEAAGLDRRQMPQILKAVNSQVEQAIEYLADEGLRSEQLLTPVIPPSQNAIIRSVMTRYSQSAALQNAKPASVIRPALKPIPKASFTSQMSLDKSNLGDIRDFCISGSATAGGRKAGSLTSSTLKQKSSSSDTCNKEPNGPSKFGLIDGETKGCKPLPSFGSSHSEGIPLKHSVLSHAQFELEMQKMIPVEKDYQDVQLKDSVFDRVAEILLQGDRKKWSFRPRTYAILRMINAVDLMDGFVEAGCLDIALPYKRGHLPKVLSPEQLDNFLRKQSCVMTTTASIEGGLKAKHANFPDDADNHLEVLNELGEGGTGQVDRIRSKLSRKVYARKRLKREETFEQNAEALKLFKREVTHLKKLKHRHLVRYVGSYTDPHHVGIIMEPVADMNFKTFLGQSVFKPAEYDCIREAFGCLCSAIIYLHRQQIRHKDIKPQNILVRERKVFITDFGLAISWKTLGKGTTTGEHGPISREYAAPEVMDSDSRNISADVWSLGCVFLEMITVLKAETIIAKSAYFLGNGSCSIFYCRNQDAMKGWMKKLESKSKKDNAPLDWIRNLTMEKAESRLTPQQLMDRITSKEALEDGKGYYGLCCDGKKDDEVAIELRDSDVEVSSGSTSQDKALVKTVLDPAAVERQLCKAAGAQDVKMLKRWLRKIQHARKRSLNTKAIHRAASLGNEEITRILIDFGCNLEYKFNGQTPLSSAIQASREETTELLARTKIAINAQTPGQLQSALHLAACRSFYFGMRILLGAGALVDIRDGSQFTPLHRAVEKGDVLGVKLLLDHGANPSVANSNGFNPLQLAASRPSDKVLQMLLDHGAKVDAHDMLSSAGSWPPIAIAVSHNRLTAVRLLLQHGANINHQSTFNDHIRPSLLHIAIDKRLFGIIDILLQHNPDLELRDSYNRTPLNIACRSLDKSLVQRLLEAGADIKTEDESLDTFVWELMRNRHFPILQLFFDHGVGLKERAPLLHVAAAQGRTELIEFLLRNHMPINAEDARYLTPLMVAAERGQAASVRLLVKNGALIDAQNRMGNTALHAAIFSNSTEIASFLLEHGADPMLATEKGFNAFLIARRFDREEIHALMTKFLELAGRIVYDDRWPHLPFFLTREEVHHGYVIEDVRGRPLIRPKMAPRGNGASEPRADDQIGTPSTVRWPIHEAI